MFIIPKPQEMTFYDEILSFSGFDVKCDNEKIGSFFDKLNDKKGTAAEVKKDGSLNGEQYKITAKDNKITVLYGTDEGAYRAAATLKQIKAQAEDGMLNAFEIFDYPSIKNRGYMLDISRGKIPNSETIKNLVDILSDLKYNQLQLYMDSFVFEYKNFPEYVKDTEPLTAKEIKELEKYCKDRFVELVPNQNGFGHMGSWMKKEELSHLAITGKDGKPSQTLNPFLEGSVELIDKIYDGFLDIFHSDKVNIGMDEPFELGLNETKEECERAGVGRVYTDYLKKICALASDKYGKTPMFWDDIVFKHPEEIVNIPKNAIVMEWGYETEQHFDRNCRRLKKQGLRFYVCPGTSTWGSFTGRTNNMLANITDACETGAYYGAEGFLLTEWGDGGNPQFPAVTYLPLVYGGAASWNCGNHNHEIAYNDRRTLIPDCKKYLDKFIYKIEGEASLADIVSRMGNYYLLEDMLSFNGTELINYLYTAKNPEKEKRAGFKRAAEYMKDLRDELKNVKTDEITLREVKNDCELVILLAEYMSGKKDDYEKRANAIKEEFTYLWKLKNHTAGMEIFLNCLDKYLKIEL